MSQPKRAWSDEKMEQIIGTLLISGVIAAALIVLAGGVLYLIRYGAAFPDYAVFRGEPPGLRSVSGIITDTLSFRIHSVIQLGLCYSSPHRWPRLLSAFLPLPCSVTAPTSSLL